MFTQITKGLSESIGEALAKHATAQNLTSQNLTKPAQNLASQASQSLAPQTQTRQALTRFGNELAQNSQTKPTQAVFDFDFIARDKTPELANKNAQISPSSAQADNATTPPHSAEGFSHNSPSSAQADTGGGLFDLPSQAKQKGEALQNLQHAPAQNHATQAQNLAPHTPQTQSLQARYDTLYDFANKMSEHKESLSHEAKSLYDSFAKSLDSLSPESLSAKELNATDRHLSEYLVRTELAQVSNAKDIVLPYFSAKYQAKNEAELAQTFGGDKLAQMRQALQESTHTNPLAEFGTNYAEFYQDGKGAINKLIAEANAAKQAGKDFSGQVAGAFSKEIDGAEASIDLVWGKITNEQTHEGYGLAHIIDKHPDLDLSLIPRIIEKGKVESKNGIHSVILEQEGKEYRIGLGKGWKGNGENEWIITAYENKKIKENGETFYHDTFTTKEPLENLDNEIIQKSAQKIQEKMKVSKEYAENLAKWHKDSHPITKEADGTPKVFYHGIRNGTPFEIFDMKKSKNNLGFYFTDKKEVANFYANQNKESKNTYEIFLNIKNPFDLSKPINSTKDLKNLENIGILPPLTKEQKDEFFRLKKIKDEAIKDLKKQGIDLIEMSGSWAYGIKNGGLFEFLEAYKDYRGFYTNNGGTITILKPEQMKLYTPAVKQFFKETRWGFYRNDFDLLLSGEYIEALGGMSNGYGFDTLKTLLNKKGYDGIKVSDYEVVVFDSNQIKAVGNKGTFEATNPNIYHSSSTAGGGVLGGSIAGVERDEEGNIIGFSPEKFALGFASGAVGAKALSKIANTKHAQNLANAKAITLSQKSIQKLATNPRAKAVLDKIKSKNDIISPEKTQKGQTNMQNPHIKTLRDNLKQALSPILNTDIINKNTGIVARLSTNGLNKISSSMAVKKSIENGFSRAEHFAVASDLKNLFENATLLKTHDDYKKKPNIKAIHRYIAQTKINDKEAQALITLKESIQNGHRIYSMELEEVKPL